MEPIILQPLREIRHLQPRRLIKLRQINQQLVRNTAIVVLVPQVVVGGEAVGHVVRVEEGDLGGVDEAFAAEHLDVGPGDEVDGGGAVGGGGDGVDGGGGADLGDRVAGEEGGEVLGDTDGSDTGTTSTVRTEKRKKLLDKVKSKIQMEAYMAKVLCKFKWQTSPPQTAGLVNPT